MTKLDVCILGGGLSGLTAACELYKQLGNTVHVTILEKEQDIGGRIFTKHYMGCPIELGAQFFIENGYVHHMLQALNLETACIPLKENFIQYYYKKSLFNRDYRSLSVVFGGKDEDEISKLFHFLKDFENQKELRSINFESWYKEKIGEQIVSFWNRVLMSIGVRDIKSINAYLGLILIKVFFGNNFLLSNGFQQMVHSLSKIVESFGGKIITQASCENINIRNNSYYVNYVSHGKRIEKKYDKIISTVHPQELTKIWKEKFLHPLNQIDGHPMTLYVLKTNTKCWEKTWGLINCEENNPIYALCDWKNVISADKNVPILAICSPFATSDEVVSEFKTLFPKIKPQCEIIFEKKWMIGLHQPNEKYYEIRNKVIKNLPSGFYLAGDWMTIPALEGAVISGMKSVELLLKNNQ